MRLFPVLAGLAAIPLLAIVVVAAVGGYGGAPTTAPMDDPAACATCHRERQPGLLAQYDASGHAQRGIGCAACHGTDHKAIFAREGRVDESRCRECHAKATVEFMASAHHRGRTDAVGEGRFLAQIPAMQRRGCLGCHDEGAASPTESADAGGRCNACHGAHRFSKADARRPEACGVCHCGPDHPQIEAWEASLHGVAYGASHDERQAPTCVTCHMPGGTHLVGGGLTYGATGAGAVLEGAPMPMPMHTVTVEQVRIGRAAMLAVCAKCHSPKMAEKALDDADAIKKEADRLAGEGVRIIEGLHRDKLLDPMPSSRPPHPTAGHALLLGGPMLYENHSEAERLFFDISKFAHAITFKGAYHQSPDTTHWLGMARLKADLEALKAEERRLRAKAAPSAAKEPP